MTQPVQVQEASQKPQGLLPKNVQSWLLVGLAFLMIAIMWLTGGQKPQPPVKATPLSTPTPVPLEVNETKIRDMQNRIEELQRQQVVAQSALAQQTRSLGVPSIDSPQAPQSTPGNPAADSSSQDPIEAERKRRAYVSLFASNVALSYRKTTTNPPTAETESTPATQSPASVGPDSPQVAQPLKQIQPSANLPGSPATTPALARTDSADSTHDQKEEPRNSVAVVPGSPNSSEGKPYLLFEGTVLETVLINRLDGQFAGPIECLLSTDVYSNDRQHLLIPAGSKLLGETKKVDTFGQNRLAVIFHRALMPDGYSVTLDQFKGLNQIGDAGLRDQVNNHYLRIFGVSLAIGALGAISEGGTAGALTASGTDMMRQGLGQSTAQSSAQILDKFLNVMPTVTIREGRRVKVYLSGDLALPEYNNHKMPSDL
ncbi:MAG: TrbI/VirB10 family protein [Candidatus Acidiferrales bacterium]